MTSDRFKGETQGALLALLRRADQSITGLAEQLRLSDNAVRTHVAGLERDGLVVPVGSRRDTGGKPARMYALTKKGEELFPKAYALVLGEVAREIARQQGTHQALALFGAVGRHMAAGAAPGDLPQRVESAARTLRGLGGDITVAAEGDQWIFQGFGCPLSQVTGSHPEVCELARALVEEITGQPVVECCDRSTRPRCSFRVEPRASA